MDQRKRGVKEMAKMSKNTKTKRANKFNNRAKSDARRGNYQDAFAEAQKQKGLEDKAYFVKSKCDANDPQWYFKQAEILRDVASFSFSKALGSRINLKDMFPTSTQSGAGMTIPGVYAMDIILTPGIARDAQSPINLAAQNAYTFIRKANSGATNYNAPDLMLYYYAMDSLYSAWNWMKRIYGEASIYNSMNRYQPFGIAKAERVDLDDIYSHLADFRAYLNMAANRISSFAVPASFNLMVRHAWMFSNVYKDSDTTRAQLYMYTPAVFYQYDETSSHEGGVLAPINVAFTEPAQPYTFATLKSLLDDMINALQYSEDIGTMSGDVIKAYGEGNLFKLGLIDVDYKLEPVYNKEVLTQFENAVYYGQVKNLTTANLPQFVVRQDPNTNWIKFQPIIDEGTVSGAYEYGGSFLNFHWDNPTPEDVIVASRINLTTKESKSGNSYKTTITSCGSEIAIRNRIIFLGQSNQFTSVADMTGIMQFQQIEVNSVGFGRTTDNTAQNILMMQLVNSFDWSPMVFISYKLDDTTSYIIPPARDWDVFTPINRENLEAMNELALLSLLNVPN